MIRDIFVVVIVVLWRVCVCVCGGGGGGGGQKIVQKIECSLFCGWITVFVYTATADLCMSGSFNLEEDAVMANVNVMDLSNNV